MSKGIQKPSSSHSVIRSVDAKKSVLGEDIDKCSIVSVICRICYDGDKTEPIITPCKCKGSVAFVHRTCLEKWLAESNLTSCEVCHYVYQTERVPAYTAQQSIWRWFRVHPHTSTIPIRGLRNDLYACAIITPLAIIITYIGLFSADYYNQKRFSDIPAAKWTALSLLIMISIMIGGYYLWVYMVIRYHVRAWYYCWQEESIVHYIPPSSISFQGTQDIAVEDGRDTLSSEAFNIFEPSEFRNANITLQNEVIPLQTINATDSETRSDIAINDNVV
uniref:Uncharacterized protein n=1 Tax=Photinus pyralis TaxID=7054 RepID=A0A1Y1LE52_PHOPY